MVWFILKHIFSTFCDLINIRQLTDQEKDLEILILRQQLSILQRKINHPCRGYLTHPLEILTSSNA